MGWVARSEESICIDCHRTLSLSWQESDDGRDLRAIAPTALVSLEPDDANPAVRWATLRARCSCGTNVARVVEVLPPSARTGAPSTT